MLIYLVSTLTLTENVENATKTIKAYKIMFCFIFLSEQSDTS